MANHYYLALIFLAIILSPLESNAGARDSIRIWRDSKGILNISNVAYPPNRVSQKRVIKPQKSIIPPANKAPLSETRSINTSTSASLNLNRVLANVYTYTDKSGVRHFTNIPVAGQNYDLVLHTNFSSPTPLRPRLTSSHLLATRKSIYDNIVAEAATEYRVDQALVNAMIHAESAFNPTAVSPKGATGLMQLMPGTAQRYGVQNAFNPTENVYGGVRYLRDLLAMFNNNLPLAIAAYNAGENAVNRYGGIPPYAETADYVQRVLALHNRYRMTP